MILPHRMRFNSFYNNCFESKYNQLYALCRKGRRNAPSKAIMSNQSEVKAVIFHESGVKLFDHFAKMVSSGDSDFTVHCGWKLSIDRGF